MFKKLLSIAVLMLVVLSIFAGCSTDSGNEPEQKIVLKFSHDLLEGTPQDVGANAFKEIFEGNTNGKYEVTIFPAGQLGDDVEIAEMLQTNAVQIALIPTAKLSGFTSTVQLFDLPFLFPSKEVAYQVFDSEITDAVFAPLEDVGMKGLSVWESGFKQFTNNVAIRKPSDFEGLDIRVMNSPLLVEQYKAVGANPVAIAFPEVYNALQLGAVDGQENPLVSITNMKFYEVQDYMTISNHGYLGYAFLVSADLWNSLDAETQTTLKEAAIEAAQAERAETAAQEEGFLNTIRESGTEIIELTAEEHAAFENAMKPVHEQFADEIGRDLLQQVYDKIDSLK